MFYFYICSFNFLNALLNKTRFILFIYYVYLWCVSLLSFFNNKEKIMTTIFIFTHLGLNIRHTNLILCYLERLCLYNMEISLAVMLKQLTMNLDKIVNRDTPTRGGPGTPPVCDCALINTISPLPLRRPAHATAFKYQHRLAKIA